ncbi:transglutaminase domain-containing protein [Curtobacterium flaccumfaciens]|nr:transglutaminase domain-containing protein [Curtobacterium flaccumfaciens]
MIGDQEQYAAAAALMADELGFPARVVMGFTSGGDAGGSSGTGSTAGGTTTFRGSDVTARVEVDTAQWGWVMIDPNPAVRDIPDEQQQTPQPVTRPETVVPPPPAEQQDQSQQAPPQSDRNTPPVQPLWLQILLAALPWVLATLGFVALVLLPFGVIVLLKRIRRRRRRRAPTPRARIVGAWDEYRDALLDRGHDVARSTTRREAVVGAPGRAAPGSQHSRTVPCSVRTMPKGQPRTACGRRRTTRSRVSGPVGRAGNGSAPRCRSDRCDWLRRRGRQVPRWPRPSVVVVGVPRVTRVRADRVTTMACRPASVVDGRVRTGGTRDQMRTLRIDAPGRGDLLR